MSQLLNYLLLEITDGGSICNTAIGCSWRELFSRPTLTVSLFFSTPVHRRCIPFVQMELKRFGTDGVRCVSWGHQTLSVTAHSVSPSRDTAHTGTLVAQTRVRQATAHSSFSFLLPSSSSLYSASSRKISSASFHSTCESHNLVKALSIFLWVKAGGKSISEKKEDFFSPLKYH